mgnify:CR=1 FL=1
MDLVTLRRLAAAGRVSRRQFVQLALATGVGIAASDMAFVKARAAEPKKGGRFRLGVAGANINDMHDPATWGTSAIVNIGLWGAVYNNLMEVAPDGALVPELAASVEPTADARTWVFKLREGISFHNGKPLDADDVTEALVVRRRRRQRSEPVVDLLAGLPQGFGVCCKRAFAGGAFEKEPGREGEAHRR